jgi:lysosomal acid phosphatase
MLVSKVLGVIVIARNGDRYNYYQDPKTYAASNTETTALGVVRLNLLYYLIFHRTVFRSSLINWDPSCVPPTST